jgi:hypothetical protein
MFGPKRDELAGGLEDYITRGFMVCALPQILFGLSNREDWDGWGMWHVWVT